NRQAPEPDNRRSDRERPYLTRRRDALDAERGRIREPRDAEGIRSKTDRLYATPTLGNALHLAVADAPDGIREINREPHAAAGCRRHRSGNIGRYRHRLLQNGSWPRAEHPPAEESSGDE